MSHKITPASVAHDLIKAAFERKTMRGKANKVIDAFFEDKVLADTALHFANEVMIHKMPRVFVYNTKKYVIRPRLAKLIQEKAAAVMLK